MDRFRRVALLPALAESEPPGAGSRDRERIAELEAEREVLLEMLAQQQRVAQAGLITSGLAHDLDNHIQVVSGATFLALQRDHPDEWKRALQKIQTQCVALSELTRAFLGFVRRRSSAEPGEFRLSQAVAETTRLTRPLARKHGVEIVTVQQRDFPVRGERRLLVQALVNLVTNAVRACSGETGRVELRLGDGPDGQARVSVADNGPGVPEGIRRRLFRPFASGGRGNGLGLFIVRQNVRRLGGSIRVQSNGDGTTFSIDLPADAGHAG